jgi:hypothetical protein
MHENRETSEQTERESGADRPEKADSPKTGANRAEESDCAIVPVNVPNKGEPMKEGLNAEAGDGRAWTVIADLGGLKSSLSRFITLLGSISALTHASARCRW